MSLSLAEAGACGNRLLDKLPREHYEALLPCFEIEELKSKEILHRRGKPIEYVNFPCTAVHSSLVYMEEGAAVEVGTIGNEGFTGVELLLDAREAIGTLVCQIPGRNMKIRVDAFRKAIKDFPDFHDILKLSGQAYMAMVSQGVACNRLHGTDNRFARWLLVTHDRVKGDKFPLTQEFLASMLGVHRPSVSVIAGLFQQAGIIKYSRGQLEIVDRARLEEASCECYSVVRQTFERLLGYPAVK